MCQCPNHPLLTNALLASSTCAPHMFQAFALVEGASGSISFHLGEATGGSRSFRSLQTPTSSFECSRATVSRISLSTRLSKEVFHGQHALRGTCRSRVPKRVVWGPSGPIPNHYIVTVAPGPRWRVVRGRLAMS